MKYLVFDYETFSEHDIKKAGAYEYARHKSTEVLCAAWTIGTRETLKDAPVKCWSPYAVSMGLKSDSISELVQALKDPSVMIIAHNALFEQVITKFVFALKYMYSVKELADIPISRWICTASMARSCGLPSSLEKVGEALGLIQQKDKEGHKLMLKMSKPKKPSKKDPSTRHLKPEDMTRLMQYCAQDIKAEVGVFLTLPELPPKERELWILDQKMNLEGFGVDRDLVLGALELIDQEVTAIDERVQEASDGSLNSARQRDAVLGALKKEGVHIESLTAGVVADLLNDPSLSDKARTLLEARQAVSKSSTAKYAAFDYRSRFDGRARDNTIFYGAHTGRQSGTGLQPQNLFKSTVPQKDLEESLDIIKAKDAFAIRTFFEKPMQLYASALRSCIVAPEGKTLDVGDFATIEVRVLFWLAGHQKGLDSIANGKDLYVEQASEIYKKPEAEILAGHKAGDKKYSTMRQLGKTVVLGAGFGIGKKKFYEACLAQKIQITEELAATAVYAYRNKHAKIPEFWTKIEMAAKMAVKNKGKKFRLGYLTFECDRNFLYIGLPIGRKLFYYKPRIEVTQGLFGEQESLTYMSVHNKQLYRNKSWGGVLTENVVQAVARDLLMEALLRLDKSEIYKPILSVHDEIVCERILDGRGSTEEYEQIMSEVPAWAQGIPIKVEAWSEPRYRK